MSSSGSITNQLKDKQQLTDSQLIRSSNSAYSAVIKRDGNFVLYDDNKKKELWSSKTSGQGTGPYHLQLQDGNLALFDGEDKMHWSTNTKNKGPSPHKLVMDDDGHLRIYDSEGKEIWSNPFPANDHLDQGTPLYNNEVISAGTYCAGMKIYNDSANNPCDSLIEYKGSYVPNPNTFLYDSKTPQPENDTSYLFLNTNGDMGIYAVSTNACLKKWPLPCGSTVIGPYFLKINADSSLNVYGYDQSGTTQLIAYPIYTPPPPS